MCYNGQLVCQVVLCRPAEQGKDNFCYVYFVCKFSTLLSYILSPSPLPSLIMGTNRHRQVCAVCTLFVVQCCAVPLFLSRLFLYNVKIYRSSVVAAAEYRICLSRETIEPIFIGYQQCYTHFRISGYLFCILICYDVCLCIRYIITFFNTYVRLHCYGALFGIYLSLFIQYSTDNSIYI